jgi:hypothetical protein
MKRIAFFFFIAFLLTRCDFPSDNVDITARTPLIAYERKFTVYRIPKDTMSFKIGNVPPADADFYLNSNFFSDEPIGLVVIEGKRHAKRKTGGGYFFVRNGKAYVRALECPKMTEYATQTILWGIDNGKTNDALLKKPHALKTTYRTLMGEDEHANIWVIASNRTGLVTIEEIVNYALNLGIVEAVLFDGGSSVEYKFTDGERQESFKAMNGWIKKYKRIQEPPVFIYGNFKRI